MARMSRIKNVERDFVFKLATGVEDTISEQLFVDMMQVHSLVNRVSTRQGMNVLIESIEIGIQTGGAYTASIIRLPQHWACVNAWEKTMRLWLQQQNDTLDDAGLESTVAKYRDFKIHMDDDHVTAGFPGNLTPQGFVLDDPTSTSDGYDWDPSNVVIPNDAVVGTTTDRMLHMLGPDNGAVSAGMIHAYAQSRSRPQTSDPNVTGNIGGGLFGEMFDVGMDDDEIITDSQNQNDNPPYLIYRNVADEAYPGGAFQGIGGTQASSSNNVPGQFVDTLAVNANQNFNSDSTGSFAAPCGLIKFCVEATGLLIPGPGPARPGEAVNGPLWMRIRLAPGHYQGIAAVPMQEAN